MHFFRVRLILALIAGVTLVSVASTYFEVMAHKHMSHQDLERRTAQKATSLLPEAEQYRAYQYDRDRRMARGDFICRARITARTATTQVKRMTVIRFRFMGFPFRGCRGGQWPASGPLRQFEVGPGRRPMPLRPGPVGCA